MDGRLALAPLAALSRSVPFEPVEELLPRVAILCSAVVAGALLVKRRRHPETIVLGIFSFATLFGSFSPWTDHDSRLGLAMWALTNPMIAPMLTVFPDGPRGRLGRRMLGLQVVAIVWGFGTGLAGYERNGSITWYFRVSQVLLIGLFITAIIATVSLGRRWRRAGDEERKRLGVLFGAAAFGFGQIPFFTILGAAGVTGPEWLDQFIELELFVWILAGIPIAIGVTVLMDDPSPLVGIVNRVLSWTMLTAIVVTVALLVSVGVANARGDDAPESTAVLLPALVVAALVTPARRFVQRPVDALLPRHAPADAALHELSGSLASTEVPADIPDVVAQTLGEVLGVGAIEIEVDGAVVGAWGETESGASPTVLPLMHAGGAVGRLRVVGALPDPTSLEVLLPHVAAAIAASNLAAQLVSARDEERARVRADLHDELSPSLAGMRMAAASFGARLRRSGRAANGDADLVELIDRIESEAGSSVHTIRRIVDGLGPLTLTEKAGLAAALRDRALSFARPGTFEVTVGLGELPSLAPDVEVAILRTASEALSNAARHSGGRHCWVRVGRDGEALVLEIGDDGKGMPATGRSGGLGLRSMRSRAEAVGGTLRIEDVEPHGTRIVATFPAGVPSDAPA
jgi:signal transduction histidine kinase